MCMAMIGERTNRRVSVTDPKREGHLPYLPPLRGDLKERLVRLRFRATYWIWKRMIIRHSGGAEVLCFLDVGCGPGNFLSCLENWFRDADITALDMSLELLRYCQVRAKKADLLQGDAEEMPFEDQAFHVVSGLQVIEHFPNPERFLGEAHRVLKEDGLLLLATPNPKGLTARLLGKSWQGIRHDHVSLRSPENWHKALEKNGFNILNEGTTLFNGIPLVSRQPCNVATICPILYGIHRFKIINATFYA